VQGCAAGCVRVAVCVLVGVLCASRAAIADPSGDGEGAPRIATERADLPARLADPDTSYGRIDGDLGLVLGVGATVGGGSPRGSAELRARYVDTAGIFVTYEDALGNEGTGPRRVLATGLELRPLFLGRWVTGRELGLAWPDLVIDSLGFEVGAFFQEPPGSSFGTRPGLQAGLGLEVPLLGRASGPWLDIHAGARWSDAVLGGGAINGPSDRAFVVSLTVAYHQLLAAHLVDLNDRAP